MGRSPSWTILRLHRPFSTFSPRMRTDTRADMHEDMHTGHRQGWATAPMDASVISRTSEQVCTHCHWPIPARLNPGSRKKSNVNLQTASSDREVLGCATLHLDLFARLVFGLSLTDEGWPHRDTKPPQSASAATTLLLLYNSTAAPLHRCTAAPLHCCTAAPPHRRTAVLLHATAAGCT